MPNRERIQQAKIRNVRSSTILDSRDWKCPWCDNIYAARRNGPDKHLSACKSNPANADEIHAPSPNPSIHDDNDYNLNNEMDVDEVLEEVELEPPLRHRRARQVSADSHPDEPTEDLDSKHKSWYILTSN
jgi:hypothetical protein